MSSEFGVSVLNHRTINSELLRIKGEKMDYDIKDISLAEEGATSDGVGRDGHACFEIDPESF